MSKFVIKLYQLGYFLHTKRVPILPKLIQYFIRILFGSFIGMGAKIGKNCTLVSGGIGVVINDKAIIGDNVVIHQNVSIGDDGKDLNAVPTIEDNCKISAGAVIIGKITIGKNSIIGANAVVTKDIPPNSIAVGIPAKVIKSDINREEYNYKTNQTLSE